MNISLYIYTRVKTKVRLYLCKHKSRPFFFQRNKDYFSLLFLFIIYLFSMTVSDLMQPINQQHCIISNTLQSNSSWFPNIKHPDQNIKDNIVYSSEEKDDDSEEEYNQAICACGKKLSAGWNCSHCRSSCSTCHRALAPEEECSRCSNYH